MRNLGGMWASTSATAAAAAAATAHACRAGSRHQTTAKPDGWVEGERVTSNNISTHKTLSGLSTRCIDRLQSGSLFRNLDLMSLTCISSVRQPAVTFQPQAAAIRFATLTSRHDSVMPHCRFPKYYRVIRSNR